MKFLDKILLLIAVALTGASAAMYLGSSTEVPEPEASGMDGGSYTPLEIPKIASVDTSWPEPQPASAETPNAIYRIFTPPAIFWDKVESTFRWEPFVPPPEVEPFGLVLVEVAPVPYRVQFQTAVRRDGETELLQFFLPDRKITIEGAPGQTFPEYGFEIRSYQLVRRVDPDGTLFRVPTAIIYDAEVDAEVELNTIEQRVLEGRWTYEVATTGWNEPQRAVWEGEQGEAIAVENLADDRLGPRRYTLLQAVAEPNPFVRVRKSFPGEPERETEVQRLEPRGEFVEDLSNQQSDDGDETSVEAISTNSDEALEAVFD